MRGAQHTPGVWFRDRASGLNCDVRAASGKKVALCFGLGDPRKGKKETPEGYRVRYERYRAECDANAVLIAESPEMLGLLQLVDAATPKDVGDPEDGGVLIALSVEEVLKLRAVIARATGSTS